MTKRTRRSSAGALDDMPRPVIRRPAGTPTRRHRRRTRCGPWVAVRGEVVTDDIQPLSRLQDMASKIRPIPVDVFIVEEALAQSTPLEERLEPFRQIVEELTHRPVSRVFSVEVLAPSFAEDKGDRDE